MIKRLRRKFVLICMLLVSAVLVVIFAALFMATRASLQQSSDALLRRVIAENDYPLLQPGQSAEVQLPYFTVFITEHTAFVLSGTYYQMENTQALEEIINDCVSQADATGTLPAYNLRYLRQNTPFGTRAAFVDISMELSTLRNLVVSLLQIAAIALLLVLGVSILLARWAVRPVARAMELQKQFLSDASHELKTPLTVILSNAELILQSPQDSPQALQRRAEHITTEATQMKQLVQQMLTLAQADSRREPPPQAPVNWSESVVSSLLLFEPMAYEAGQRLIEEITPDLRVLGDEEALHRLTGILLDNAVKYTPTDGAISVCLRRQEKKAVLTVTNEGPPIPPEHLPHLFERFYRADPARTDSGFGLGLAIAKSIVQEHQGSIAAESDDSATRFTVTLPLC